MDKLAHLEDEGKRDTAQQIIDAAQDVLLQRPLGTHEEHIEGAYEKLSDELKLLADELIAFNREQFGLDVGK